MGHFCFHVAQIMKRVTFKLDKHGPVLVPAKKKKGHVPEQELNPPPSTD